MSLKIYLAARYSRREELCEYADELRAAGFTVDARWLLGEHHLEADTGIDDKGRESMPMEAQPFAVDDFEDVLACDVLIAFTEPSRSCHSRGGRHVETGLAMAWGKRVIVVGPRENVFHAMPQVRQYDEWGPDVILAVTYQYWEDRYGKNPHPGIRQAVIEYAVLMEKVLREHDHKGNGFGWGMDALNYFIRRLKDETIELLLELWRPRQDPGEEYSPMRDYKGKRLPRAVREAVDVSNFAMMIHARLKDEKERE